MAERKKYNFKNAAKILETTAADSMEQTLTGVESVAGSELEIDDVAKRIDAMPVQSRLQKIQTSAGGLKAFNFKYIPREKLTFHKDNKYPMEEIKRLSETILKFGLIHNLEVLYEEETDTYTIESGERRTRAIDLLVEQFRDAADQNTEGYQLYLKHVKQFAEEGYPCNVKRQELSEDTERDEREQIAAQIESKIRLRLANEEVRSSDPIRTRTAVMELHELYTQLNALSDRRDKLNVNEAVAEQMGMSSRQIKNYTAIERLIPELKALFEDNSITLKDGANYAKLSEEEQKQIVELIKEGGSKQELKLLTEKMSQLQADLRKKETDLQKIEQDRNQALKDLSEEQERIRLLSEQMQQVNSTEEMDQTKKQLADAKRSLQEYEHKVKVLEDEQREKIKKLEKRLAEKERQPMRMLSATTKAAWQLEHIIHELEEAADQFEKVLADYQKCYDPSAGELSPEKYAGRLQKIMASKLSKESLEQMPDIQLKGQMNVGDYPGIVPESPRD